MADQIHESEEREIDLVKIFLILWKGRTLIAVITAAFIVLAVSYMFYATPLYRSKITLYSVADTKGISPLSSMAKELGIMSSMGTAQNYNIPDIVKSRMLSEKILSHKWKIKGYDEEVTLLKYYDDIRGFEKSEDAGTSEQIEKSNKTRLEGYSEFLSEKRIIVSENKQTSLVTVFVHTEQPELSKDVANYISLFVTKWVNDIQKRNSIENLAFIKERLEIEQVELAEAENDLKVFRDTNRNIFNSADLQLEITRLQREVVIKQEVYITLIKQKELSQIEENKNVNVVQILDTATEKNKPYKPNKAKVLAISLAFPIIFLSVLMLFTVYLNYLTVRAVGRSPKWMTYFKDKILFRKYF